MSENDEYEVLEKIGHGSFGIIRKVRRKADGKIMCRKEISYLKMTQKEREQLHAEFQILSSLRHPNIVGYYHREHLKATQDLHLYMEYCGNGDLGRVIRDLAAKNQYAEEWFVWSIFTQLVTALYRCHYGVDPPEVGKSILGIPAQRPKPPPGAMTILHRDLKPENVFLGEDNSVKLGDFGLSKVMESHDFASTYVGTPFYMSPEICAAEKYTLKSDIWSLGCIIYELCTREPPFNAKTHYQLVQKIKEGKINPLPAVYSQELFSIIKDCLRVNPDRRPDTATLLNLPVVRLMRKEREVNDFNKTLKQKEESLNRRVKEVEQKAAALEQKAAALQQEKAALEQQKVALEQQKTAMRQEIEAAVRREWEVKARLEIDRLVALEIEQLHKKFEQEVQLRVEMELQKRKATIPSEADRTDLSSSASGASSSISGRSADSEQTSTTDATDLTVESPDTSMHPLKRSVTRTPFTRAHTMFAAPVGTPMDIEMASPSPMTVQSLSLSPRRNFLAKPPTVNPGNIFAMAGESKDGAARRSLADSDTDADVDVDDANIDDDDIVPSPTRLIKHSNKNPFNPKQRPQLPAQQTVLPFHQRLKSKQSTATQGKTVTPAPSNSDFSSIRPVDSGVALQDRSNSPTRRVTKIPSTINMRNNATETATSGSGLLRKPSLSKKDSCDHQSQNSQNINPSQPSCLNKIYSAPNSIKSAASVPSITTATSCGNIRGRTLVELQQARAGGRPLSAVMSSDGHNPNCAHHHHHHHNHTHTHVVTNTSSPVRAFREHAAAANRGIVPVTTASALASEPPAVWDPEKDDMPSPFLVRRKPVRA